MILDKAEESIEDVEQVIYHSAKAFKEYPIWLSSLNS